MGLSAKNGWYDEESRVYIYYPSDEAELDIGIGLIKRVRQGLGRPSVIHVKQFTTKAVPAPQPDDGNSRSTKTEPPEVPKEGFS